MTYIYTSPVLGEISEDIYNTFISLLSKDFNTFINKMKSDLKYGTLRSGVLVVETKFKDVEVSGTDIYNYLMTFGFSESASINITKLFSVNNRLIENLVEDGFNLNDVAYGLDLKGRLDTLGLESATATKTYALADRFTVHRIIEVYVEPPPPPPPPELCYRTQLAYLYVAETRKSGTPEIVAEFRVWGVSNEKGRYELSKFERVIMQMERIMKGDGMKPKHWLASIKKIIKASEQDEEIDCDEAKTEINYALRGVSFRGEHRTEQAIEYAESWIKHTEKRMIDEGKLITRFDNESGTLKNVTAIEVKGKETQ